MRLASGIGFLSQEESVLIFSVIFYPSSHPLQMPFVCSMYAACSYFRCISVPSHSPGLGRTNMVPPSPVVHHASCRVWAMWTVRWPVGKVGTCADQCQLKIGGWFGLRTKNRTKTCSQIEIHYSLLTQSSYELGLIHAGSKPKKQRSFWSGPEFNSTVTMCSSQCEDRCWKGWYRSNECLLVSNTKL